MSQKRLLKELKQLNKHHASLTNAQILSLEPCSEDSLYEWKAVIAKPTKADSAFYYNGQWTLNIKVEENYPKVPPKVRFSTLTPICHPNVNIQTGEICLDILTDKSWLPAWNLEHVVVAILVLIDDPEPDSPLNIDLANLYRSDLTAFESVVQYYIWKFGTFYEGAKEPSGVKLHAIIGYDVSSEEEDEPDSEQDEPESKLEKKISRRSGGYGGQSISESYQNLSLEGGSSGNGSKEEDESSVERQEEKKKENVKHIQLVGREVTEEFIKKANEVGASEPSSPNQQQFMQSVHQQVADNVLKQVEEICSKTGRPPQPPRSAILDQFSQQDVEQVKEKFLRQIDQQVDEIRRHNDQGHQGPLSARG